MHQGRLLQTLHKILQLHWLLEDVFGFFDELTMQVDRIRRDVVLGIVFAEDELGSLLVVLFHLCTVLLPFIRKGLCCSTISAVVGFLAALEAITSFGCFLTC